MRRVETYLKNKFYYVTLVRITHKGERIYKKNLHRIMTEKAMLKKQRQLAQEYDVPMGAVAFEHEQMATITRLCQMALNDSRKRCKMK